MKNETKRIKILNFSLYSVLIKDISTVSFAEMYVIIFKTIGPMFIKQQQASNQI